MHDLPRLQTRERTSHKGDYGRALLVGGSRGMTGAIALAGMAALRGGAGLVTLAVPRTVQDVVANFHPAVMTIGMADDGDRFSAASVDELLSAAQKATAIALGPGLGHSAELAQVVERLYREATQPMIVDADGLNAVAERPDALANPGGPRILTPHPAEFARLFGGELKASDVAVDEQDRVHFAGELARRDPAGRTVVVLKGHRTVVSDGQRHAINTTGNPGMATGGTGDVLTGLITALLCQKLEPWDAARLGTYLHGKAGDLAAHELGEVSLIATDLIDFLPMAFQTLA
jgi:ADP-dependent NAD(P)H-hydrate dehydratase